MRIHDAIMPSATVVVALLISTSICHAGLCDHALTPAANGENAALIENALYFAGDGGIVELMNGATFDIKRPIRIPESNRTLTTCRPTGTEVLATLRVIDRNGAATTDEFGGGLTKDATAINMLNRADVTISWIEIEGGGPWTSTSSLPWGSDYRTPLIYAGGGRGDNQRIEYCVLREPLGWTAIHGFAGTYDSNGVPGCRNLTVQRNEILNAGRPGYSGGLATFADGISMGCTGTVRLNEIRNPTDGGIVVFAPQVTVARNDIRSVASHLMGGINIVDCVSSGNYTSLSIANNEITTRLGGTIDVGIGVGSKVWICTSCSAASVFDMTGSTIRDNFIDGEMKYGMAVVGVSGLSTYSNTFGDEWSGVPAGCPGVTPPPASAALVATEDAGSNSFGEGWGVWSSSYPASRFGHMIRY